MFFLFLNLVYLHSTPRSLYVFQLLELNNTFVFPDGNGFKTSTMRLGADVIVFSRATSARYFMLFLLLCWFLPHALFSLNLFTGCTHRIVFNCIWLYIFTCRKVQSNVHSFLKTLFILIWHFISVCPLVCMCVQVCILQLRGYLHYQSNQPYIERMRL